MMRMAAFKSELSIFLSALVFNIFKIDPNNWSDIAGNGQGMFTDSQQPWTRNPLVFSLSEFWVYPLNMVPGRNDVVSLPELDPVELPLCNRLGWPDWFSQRLLSYLSVFGIFIVIYLSSLILIQINIRRG